jgi:hypothetical protein
VKKTTVPIKKIKGRKMAAPSDNPEYLARSQ